MDMVIHVCIKACALLAVIRAPMQQYAHDHALHACACADDCKQTL